MLKTKQAFIKTVSRDCQKHDITFQPFLKEEVFSNGSPAKCSGYFDPVNRELTIALLQENWFETLVHEYCHFQQYLKNKFTGKFFNNILNIFWSWIDWQTEYKQETLIFALDNIIECERDCEKRTVQLMKKHFWGIDIKKYTQQANSYLCFYPALLDYRNWNAGSPINFQEIYSLFPNNRILILEEIWKIGTTSRARRLIDQLCFKNKTPGFIDQAR